MKYKCVVKQVKIGDEVELPIEVLVAGVAYHNPPFIGLLLLVP